MYKGGWGTQGGSGYLMVPPLEPGMEVVEIYDAAVQAFTSTLQGEVVAGVGVSIPYPSPAKPTGRFAALLLFRLQF